MNKFRPLPSKEILNELFRYEDGFLYWNKSDKFRCKGRIGVGVERPQVLVNYRMHGVSRIIYKMHHGVDAYFCDHIDEDPFNNNIDNLQSISHGENIRKSKAYIKLYDLPKKEKPKHRLNERAGFSINKSILKVAKFYAKNIGKTFSSYITELVIKDLIANKMIDKS